MVFNTIFQIDYDTGVKMVFVWSILTILGVGILAIGQGKDYEKKENLQTLGFYNCEKCGETFPSKRSIGAHRRWCKKRMKR
jgi:hypothetical protein